MKIRVDVLRLVTNVVVAVGVQVAIEITRSANERRTRARLLEEALEEHRARLNEARRRARMRSGFVS